MANYVVDASIAVKWLVSEAFSEESAQLLASTHSLIAPELLFAEAANALWALCRRGDITENDLAEAIDVLKTAPVSVPSSMQHLTPSAARLAADLDHPVYDCFYLALAMQTNYPLITADMRFFNKVDGHPYLGQHIRHISQNT